VPYVLYLIDLLVFPSFELPGLFLFLFLLTDEQRRLLITPWLLPCYSRHLESPPYGKFDALKVSFSTVTLGCFRL
jgi:hypothetical protein